MIVTIPIKEAHEGHPSNLATYEISDNCPICGRKRGRVYGCYSFDGSRRLGVDGWKNSCGHIDKYRDIRNQGKRVAFKEPEKQ